MLESKHPLTKSFGYAFDGIKVAFVKGRNFRIQVVLGIMAITLGVSLNLNAIELSILALTISIVLILELVNTAIESAVDLASPEIKAEAKVAKDVSAAAVLIAATTSIAVAIFLFVPKLQLLI